MKEHPTSANKEYPWYDDRMERLYAKEPSCGFDGGKSRLKKTEPESYDTPKKIYEYLNQHVWKQEAAKKAASIVAYHCFERGIKSNTMFVGPTGCGKTYIWRCLKEIFPGRIDIVDGSNLTLDGWNGSKKWSSLLRSPIFRAGNSTILVIDEVDKMLTPKYSKSENVSASIQSEGLTLMEGTRVDIKEGNVTYEIDTSKISFVLCGAFSLKAHDMAEKERGSRMGFGSVQKETAAYERQLEETDLIEFGVMPEFMGRMQRIVNLEPMTVDDYYKIADSPCGPLRHIRQQYGAEIRLTAQMRRRLAKIACSSGLGIRGMENQIRAMLDDALFENCDQRRFEF